MSRTTLLLLDDLLHATAHVYGEKFQPLVSLTSINRRRTRFLILVPHNQFLPLRHHPFVSCLHHFPLSIVRMSSLVEAHIGVPCPRHGQLCLSAFVGHKSRGLERWTSQRKDGTWNASVTEWRMWTFSGGTFRMRSGFQILCTECPTLLFQRLTARVTPSSTRDYSLAHPQ